MVAVSDALDDFMSSLEKFKDVVKLEFTCMRRSYGAKIYLTLRSVEHGHCICGGKIKVRRIREVTILQHFLQGYLFAAETEILKGMSPYMLVRVEKEQYEK